MSNLMDIMDAFSRKQSQYSVDEIEQAKKKARKTGRPFLDVLQESTGKTFDSSHVMKAEEINDICDTAAKDIEDLNKHLEQDFGINRKEQTAAAPPAETKVDPAAFSGVETAAAEKVFGQDAFLKKLNVAFKRPFILPEEGKHARNCISIYGPKDSGRHYGLKYTVEELFRRKILQSGEIYTVDLSRYPSAGKDNVFLQDLYAALSSKSRVILFENFRDCHISYLSYVNDLVIKGECYLQDRYILQRGQLVNVSNSFAAETVSTFTAAGKYLVFIGDKGVEDLANIFGAPFVNALGDVCRTEPLTEESWRKIAAVNWTELKETAEKQLAFRIRADEEQIFAAALACTGKNAGTEGLLSFFDRLEKGLATLRLEGDYPQDAEVNLSIEDHNMIAEIDGQSLNLMEHLPAAYTGDIEQVKEQLDQIVGLTEIKEYIFSLEEYYKTYRRRTEAGLKASQVSKHMIFTGNPGTGKTTIARIISQYLKAIGVLSGGQLVEVSRADLVGRYVGHTAPLVNQVIKSAIGGVLFIDEAYSLYRGKDDSFGLEAIDTLVKGIEDNRDNLIVILAGYSHEMQQFLTANSGLKSRFPNIIEFPDYTGQELLDITKVTVKSKGYTLDPEAEESLLEFYNRVQAEHSDTAGNGRLVRNKVEEAILNQSRRLVAEPDADLSLLKLGDFELEEYDH